MKRTPLKRGQPLRRSGRLRRTRLKQKGKRTKKSGGHLFYKRRDSAYMRWLSEKIAAGQLRCLLYERGAHWCSWGLHRCHVRSRGAGGADGANVVILCRSGHDEQHRIGTRSFERKYQVTLAHEAIRLHSLYLLEVGS